MTLAKITECMNWKDIFYYDETSPSGLRNKIGRGKAKIDSPSGWLSKEGYYKLEYKNVNYRCHRIIFEMLVRPLSEDEQIDHINGDISDNRLINLRVVTASLNGKNKSKRSDNTSGITGVYFLPDKDRWVAKWRTIDGKQRHKYFKEEEDAVKYRNDMVNSLNKQGAGYSERHGL